MKNIPTKKQQIVIDARDRLKTMIDKKKGITIIIKSVSASGMSRKMKVYNHDCTSHLTYNICELLGYKYNDNNTITIGGCGMDMTFWLANSITYNMEYTKLQKSKLTWNGSGCLPWKTL